MLETKRNGRDASLSKEPLNVGGGSLRLPLFMTFKQAAISSMLLKNLRQPALLAGMLIGGSAMFAGSAQASLSTITCNFTVAQNECLGNSGIGWFSTPGILPIVGAPQLGDKLLNILSYTFDDFTNAGVPMKATGHFDFSWLDQDAVGPSTGDTWNLRAVFDNAITGDAIQGNATGALNYTLTITDPNFKYSSVALDSGHIGIGSMVKKAIGGVPYLTSMDGSNSTLPLSGTFVDVTDSYTVPASGGINSFNNGFTQTSSVPGPLPLFGAGAAFGFSRRIRSRIKGARLV